MRPRQVYHSRGTGFGATASIHVAAGKAGGLKIDLDNSTQELGRNPPIGRVADAAEQARCIRVLASDDASYVVGAVFSVDGGSTARSGSCTAHSRALVATLRVGAVATDRGALAFIRNAPTPQPRHTAACWGEAPP